MTVRRNVSARDDPLDAHARPLIERFHEFPGARQRQIANKASEFDFHRQGHTQGVSVITWGRVRSILRSALARGAPPSLPTAQVLDLVKRMRG